MLVVTTMTATPTHFPARPGQGDPEVLAGAQRDDPL